MKAATIKELKDELGQYPQKDLLAICLRLARFKKENKELLTYLLYESKDEAAFIEGIKEEMDEQFEQINRRNFYFIKKSIRKILTGIRKYIRYSKNKETEVELLIYFCHKLNTFYPSIDRSKLLRNLYARQVEGIKTKISKLHEDLQYDYQMELEDLNL